MRNFTYCPYCRAEMSGEVYINATECPFCHKDYIERRKNFVWYCFLVFLFFAFCSLGIMYIRQGYFFEDPEENTHAIVFFVGMTFFMIVWKIANFVLKKIGSKSKWKGCIFAFIVWLITSGLLKNLVVNCLS